MNQDIKNLEIGEVMQSGLTTVGEYEPLTSVVKIFKDNRFHHVPVLDDQSKLVGMVSQTDIDRLSWGKTLFKPSGEQDLNRSLYESFLVRDVMSKNVHFLYDTQKVSQAIVLFDQGRFHAIPVIKDGEVVGIITPQDILNTLL
jgi:acetoin utilization protein AcuB